MIRERLGVNSMASANFFDGLIGNISPVVALYKDIVGSGVRVECFPGGRSPYTGNGGTFATADWHSNEGVWKIYFPAGAHAHQVYHELLHIRFKNVEGAPVMAASIHEAQLRRNVEELNNDFDHAYVVPLEIATYSEAAVYWEADFTRVLEGLPPPSSEQVNVAQRKITLLRGWLILPNSMPTATVTHLFRRELASGGWLDAANELIHRVRVAGANKALAVQAFREALGFDFPPAAKVTFLI
ncbi:hypothetical protein ACIPEN_14085 [Herbaspirillum chlorophenolicum]|uniref:IrrE N-terminal-like domain-containing protein n=1 Tax=Herbaspirillum chlorophenolicum TaxID=211589 RepID=A0ABW8F114_9BURK